MLPAEGLFIAQYKMMSSLGLLNNVLGLAMLYTAAVVPFTIWMLRGFVAGVPVDLEEAAMVDGLSRTQAFLRITFPLLAPGLVASAVYAFLQAWNEFTVALVVMTEEQAKTLPLWLRGFLQASAMRETDWGISCVKLPCSSRSIRMARTPPTRTLTPKILCNTAMMIHGMGCVRRWQIGARKMWDVPPPRTTKPRSQIPRNGYRVCSG